MQHDELHKALGLGPKGSTTERRWPLPNMVQVTEKEYWHWRSAHFKFKDEAWAGQVQVEDGWGTLMLFFADQGHHLGGGFAVLSVYSGPGRGARYYTWGDCAHTFDRRKIGNCVNRYTCAKCGRAYDIDSSD